MKKPSKLAIWRLEAGLSQEELAKALKVSTSLVSNWENGAMKIPGNILLLYAEIIRKPTAKLVEAFEEVYGSESAKSNREKLDEKQRMYFQKYYQQNREKITKKNRERYLRDREKALAYQHEYYQRKKAGQST